MQQCTALYVVPDSFYKIQFSFVLNSIFPITVLAGKYRLRPINSCIRTSFRISLQLTKKAKQQFLFKVVIFKNVLKLVIVSCLFVQNVCLSTGVATRRAIKISANMYLSYLPSLRGSLFLINLQI